MTDLNQVGKSVVLFHGFAVVVEGGNKDEKSRCLVYRAMEAPFVTISRLDVAYMQSKVWGNKEKVRDR